MQASGPFGSGRSRAPAEQSVVRVVLIGRTGLDVALRRDPTIELVRVRTTFEAIGEVTEPPLASPDAPSVLVLGDLVSAETVREFVRAVRAVDPSAAVVISGDSTHAGLCDGVVSPSATSGEVRRLVAGVSRQGRESGREDEPAAPIPVVREDVAAAVGRSRGAGAREGRPAATGHAGDEPLVDAVLGGQDVMPLAMELARGRLGRDDLLFVPVEADRGDADSAHGASVSVSGRVVGRLIVSGEPVASARLSELAGWLGGWLRLSEQTRSLRRAAFTDPLTGAWNRRYCYRYLESVLDRARAARNPLTVLYFDIDGFKQYNDRYGHAAGDEILCEVVRALRSVVRPSDRVCRIGGDEFVVIFYEPEGPRRADSRPPESVYVLTQRVQEKIRERKFPKLGRDAPGELTISGGLATFPWDGADVNELLDRADKLAIQSKLHGKNAITLGPGAERVCDVRRGRPDREC